MAGRVRVGMPRLVDEDELTQGGLAVPARIYTYAYIYIWRRRTSDAKSGDEAAAGVEAAWAAAWWVVARVAARAAAWAAAYSST